MFSARDAGMRRDERISSADADIIIVGAGCAGLSLAARLATRPRGRTHRVMVLEQRAALPDDRIFSQWHSRPHPFEDCVRARWARWQVAAGNRVIERGEAGHVYESITARDFHDEARRLMDSAPRSQLRLGVAAGAVGADRDGAWVDTAQGRLRAALVVDTRPEPPRAEAHGLLQIFAGCEVETDRDVFDASVVQLMLFEPPDPAAINFCHVLPFAPHRALIEYTRFAAASGPPPGQDEVERRIAARVGCGFRVIRYESGTLAMRVAPRQPADSRTRVLRLGTVAGAARAATGYAFATIQWQADALAEQLDLGCEAARGWQAPAAPRWMREMDRLFLRMLRADPKSGPALLTDLFEYCPPAALVRFLSGASGICDTARVAWAMPARPLMRQVLARHAA